jgi:Tfp pilus assembly protein PilN
MRRARAGLFIDDGVLGFAAVTGAGLTEFRHQIEEAPGVGLKGELEARQLRLRGVRIGLRRARVIVKALDLPAASARGDLAEMVGFEMERHVPFGPEEMAWSWTPLPSPKGGTVRVLVAACERRAVEQALRILEESRLRPLSVTVACHELPSLLARGARPERAIWAHRAGRATDLLVMSQGRLLLSRTVAAAEPMALASEVTATAALLRWPSTDALWISGDDGGLLLEAPELAGLGAARAAPPWSPAVAPLISGLPADDVGTRILAVAVALGARRASLDLLPPELHPRRLSAGQVLTGATTALAVILAVAVLWADARRDQRYLGRLNRALKALDPEVRAVEQIRAEVAQKKRLLAAIRAAEQNSLRPLPLLRDLTEAIPQDAWISALSADAKGVEITGQAGAANQLIPILDGSRWLDRVEFTSPVTRGRDKEQFRLRAGWEVGPRGPAQPAAAAGGELGRPTASSATGATPPAVSMPSGPAARPGATPARPAPPAPASPAPATAGSVASEGVLPAAPSAPAQPPAVAPTPNGGASQGPARSAHDGAQPADAGSAPAAPEPTSRRRPGWGRP